MKPRVAPTLFLVLLVACSVVTVGAGCRGKQTVFVIRGDAMHPSLKDGQHVLVTRLTSAETSRIPRWAVVVFDPPEGTGSSFAMKRVVGLPGERVEQRDGQLMINGAKPSDVPQHLAVTFSHLTRSLAFRFWLDNGYSCQLKSKEYFVMGDNPAKSQDSRIFGPISADAVFGIVAGGAGTTPTL